VANTSACDRISRLGYPCCWRERSHRVFGSHTHGSLHSPACIRCASPSQKSMTSAPPSTSPDQSRWWLHRARDVTSQGGEDGILEAVFEVVPGGHRWACEFGAWDGRHLSNTHHL